MTETRHLSAWARAHSNHSFLGGCALRVRKFKFALGAYVIYVCSTKSLFNYSLLVSSSLFFKKKKLKCSLLLRLLSLLPRTHLLCLPRLLHLRLFRWLRSAIVFHAPWCSMNARIRYQTPLSNGYLPRARKSPTHRFSIEMPHKFHAF